MSSNPPGLGGGPGRGRVGQGRGDRGWSRLLQANDPEEPIGTPVQNSISSSNINKEAIEAFLLSNPTFSQGSFDLNNEDIQASRRATKLRNMETYTPAPSTTSSVMGDPDYDNSSCLASDLEEDLPRTPPSTPAAAPSLISSHTSTLSNLSNLTSSEESDTQSEIASTIDGGVEGPHYPTAAEINVRRRQEIRSQSSDFVMDNNAQMTVRLPPEVDLPIAELLRPIKLADIPLVPDDPSDDEKKKEISFRVGTDSRVHRGYVDKGGRYRTLRVLTEVEAPKPKREPSPRTKFVFHPPPEFYRDKDVRYYSTREDGDDDNGDSDSGASGGRRKSWGKR